MESEIKFPSWVHHLTGWAGADLQVRSSLLEVLCAAVKPRSLITNSLTLVILAGLILAQTRNPIQAAWFAAVIAGGFLPRIYALKLRRVGHFDKRTDAKAFGFLLISAAYGLIWGAGPFLLLPALSGATTGIFLFIMVFGTIMGPYAAMPGILYVRLVTTGTATLIAVALYMTPVVTFMCIVIAGWLALRTDVWRGYHRTLRRELELRQRLQGQFRSTQSDNQHLREIANTDPLTGAFNRRALMARLESIHLPAALLLIDVDHFKSINDTHGHQTGDAILVELVRLINGTVRKQDFVARIGGEEFIVLLEDTERQQALALVKRLHSNISGKTISIAEHRVSMTVSIGVTMVPAEATAARQDALDAADKALYDAKRNGRNRISVFEPVEGAC